MDCKKCSNKDRKSTHRTEEEKVKLTKRLNIIEEVMQLIKKLQ